MKTDFSEEDKYLRAKKKVDNIKGFYSNLLAYCLIIPFLIFINLMTSPNHIWFWWPLFGWGIGVILHGFNALDHNFILGKGWEERKIREFMDKEKFKF